MAKKSKFHVIKDTREKDGHGWWFEPDTHCSGTTEAKLDVGDYSIKGLEEVLAIERKKSVSELATNFSEKRFSVEMLKLAQFEYAFLLLEFPWYDIWRYPDGSDIPRARWSKLRVRGPHIMGLITSLQIKKGIHVIACNDAMGAEKIAYGIMRKVNDHHHDSKNS